MPKTRLEFLIRLYKAGNLTEDQHDEMLQKISLKENESLYKQFLKEEWDQFHSSRDVFNDAQSDQMLLDIFNAPMPNQGKLKKIASVRWASITIAASLLLFIGLAILFHSPDKPKDRVTTLQKETLSNVDLEPGGNHAVLTLADKTKIVLDNALNGELASQGNIIITKTHNGELVLQVLPSVENNSQLPVINSITTPLGGQYNIILPDGTRVWLNSATTLTFPSYFKGNKRVVKLSGEGYFEVAKNKQMPFVVEADQSKIEVLGTHFNVEAYPDEKVNRTTLIEGIVKISAYGSSKVLKPGNLATVDASDGEIGVSQVNVEEAMAWKNGYFVFSDEDIHSIMKKLGRWYNFETRFEGNSINENFGATISRSKTLAEVLTIFEKTGTIRFKIVKDGATQSERRVVVMK